MALAPKLCKRCKGEFTPDHHAQQYCDKKCKAPVKAKPQAGEPTKVSTAVLKTKEAGKPTGPLVSTKQSADPKVLDGLGVEPLTHMSDAPVVVKEIGGPGGMKIMESRQTPVTRLTAQPFLSEESASKLGILTWHRFKLDKHVFTCVVNKRRLMLTEATFQNMKDQGKALQDG